MKLNIEELAREAGRSASLQYSKAVDDGGLISWEGAKMEAFTRLIVGRCATIVQENADECSRDSIGWLVLNSNAAAIRSLLEAE